MLKERKMKQEQIIIESGTKNNPRTMRRKWAELCVLIIIMAAVIYSIHSLALRYANDEISQGYQYRNILIIKQSESIHDESLSAKIDDAFDDNKITNKEYKEIMNLNNKVRLKAYKEALSSSDIISGK